MGPPCDLSIIQTPNYDNQMYFTLISKHFLQPWQSGLTPLPYHTLLLPYTSETKYQGLEQAFAA